MGRDASADEHAAIDTSALPPPLDVDARPAPPSLPVVVPTTGLSGSSPTPLPSEKLHSEKHGVVLKLFRSEGKHPAWVAAVDAWWALEHATGFYDKTLPALPARGRPDAVSWWVQRARKDSRIPAGLDADDDSKEDFYDRVVSWWNDVNPAWRKEGLGCAADFEKNMLNKEGGGSFEGLVSGLNGLTSVIACLWWWYRLAGIADGTPRWTKLVEDVTWVLSEKLRACTRKRSAAPSEDEPPSQRVRLV
ncbi:hypothetical protein DFH08DRAFT_716055 [Mycena albidolilacea]|uniref:Uncharacterized protein n=1 Tax=Mycena albidolilacea TaxID=1033008 RepID=A0AAD6ZBE2_9AGAR|nr:hypothetical protein DFH08DRAFT_716055 [Mycena albidolilacea]